MVDNTRIAAKSALQAAFSSANTLPLLVNSSSAHSQSSGGGGGMKLEAVMENLQRQQAARLALEEKLRQAEKEKDIRSMVESQIQQQALAFRHYQAAVRGAFAGGAPKSPMASLGHPDEQTVDSDIDDYDLERGMDDDERDLEEDDSMNEGGGDEDLEGPLAHYPPRHAIYPGAGQSPKSTPIHLSRVQPSYAAPRQAESPSGLAPQAQSQNHEWTYEEQFKQSGHDSGPGRKLKESSIAFGGGGSSSLIQELYELDDDEKRKEFLDDLFSFMQKRGTPVNRIPIMAKQVLDLYTLYKLVTEKGGLVEVINKKIWREITKGLNLPTSITSAAFTLRTQYMKYLYPYECEKRGLSSPGELQAAIDSNRREGRRQSYGSTLFNYSPVGTPTLHGSPKLHMPHISMTTPNGGHMAQTPLIKKEDSMLSNCLTNRMGIPVSLAGHHSAAQAVAAQAAAAAAVQAAALEQLREKLESGEPPEKKVMLMAEEQQRIMQHALQQNLFAMATQLPMNIKLNNRDDRQETALNLSTNGISSINMSIEINGVVYTGVLFARKPAIGFIPGSQRVHHQHSTQGKSSSPGLSIHMPPSSSSSTASSHGPATSP
ncbi:AT-rich interactive domain-containing protein 3A isoform X1 [Xyrauchen texanus]|uniref:AT-rich interactive domain-containing protein 3A isoform X1 n=1 Tax=Xyrauchen texanus TaxID=154827 RepID=UPI002241B66E|nr:AT-rich interactive domain-containing protein 3A isoform X1 [Xyrauchen texanus]